MPDDPLPVRQFPAANILRVCKQLGSYNRIVETLAIPKARLVIHITKGKLSLGVVSNGETDHGNFTNKTNPRRL